MGGFYVTNTLTPNMKVGDKFDEGTIVAKNEDFFHHNQTTGNTDYKSGPLARVAVMHSSSTFEDSTIISEDLAERMSTYVTHEKQITIGKNSNVYHISKIGDMVKVGDPLLLFDESYDDEYLNKILSKMNEDAIEDIKEAGKTPVKSKYNGEIVDVKIYYTVPKNELSPSLNKILIEYEKDIKKRTKIFNENNIDIKDLTSLNEVSEFIKPVNGKVKGV